MNKNTLMWIGGVALVVMVAIVVMLLSSGGEHEGDVAAKRTSTTSATTGASTTPRATDTPKIARPNPANPSGDGTQATEKKTQAKIEEKKLSAENKAVDAMSAKGSSTKTPSENTEAASAQQNEKDTPSPLGAAIQGKLVEAFFPCMTARVARGESFDGVLRFDLRARRDKKDPANLETELEKVEGPDLSEADYTCIQGNLEGLVVEWKDAYNDELDEDAWKNVKLDMEMSLKGKKSEVDAGSQPSPN